MSLAIQERPKHRIMNAGTRPKFAMRYEVPTIRGLDDLKSQIELLLGKRRLHGKIVTFGSCFAVNVGRALMEKGRQVYTLLIAEEINSAFNNVKLLERVFHGTASQLTDELERETHVNYFALQQEFKNATTIVFTLGNIFRLENAAGSTLRNTDDTKLVAETFQQTVMNVQRILSLLAKNTNAKVYVTVSPIPISGYKGTEFNTAMEADCASKSQLRAALRQCQGFEYLPIFEVFKWLPPHQEFATFGIDDGKSRHLGQSHVNLVMEQMS